MKPIRWTQHALEALAERQIDRNDAERVLRDPTTTRPTRGARKLFAREYQDAGLAQGMALCVVAEEVEQEIIVVTCFKSSKLDKYLKTR